MSQWYYQQGRHLGGPVSFTRLARLVADDELSEADLVCRAGEADWLPISSIVGLRRACDVLSGRRRYVAPAIADTDASEVTPASAAESRQRCIDEVYRRTVNGPAESSEDRPPMSRRDALLVFGPLGVLVASLFGAVLYQLTYDPWKDRTYKRDSDNED